MRDKLLRRDSQLFPYVRAAAMHPRRTELPQCYMDKVPDDMAKSVLGLFGAYDAITIHRFVRGCADELWKVICDDNVFKQNP